MLIQFLVVVAGSLSSFGGTSGTEAMNLGNFAVLSQKAPDKLCVRKFILLHVNAKYVFHRLDRKKLKEVDFMSSDPTDNSIVARGTECGLKELGTMIAELDKKLP